MSEVVTAMLPVFNPSACVVVAGSVEPDGDRSVLSISAGGVDVTILVSAVGVTVMEVHGE